MPLCPICATPLQTLDLPCPACDIDTPGPARIAYEYSKTFTNRTHTRYRPDEFVASLNEWLADQPGLLVVDVRVHQDRQSLVGAVTLTCRAESAPVDFQYQLERMELRSGWLGRRRTEVGEGLNRWLDANPHRRRVNYWVLSSNGVPMDLWILFMEARPAVLTLG